MFSRAARGKPSLMVTEFAKTFVMLLLNNAVLFISMAKIYNIYSDILAVSQVFLKKLWRVLLVLGFYVWIRKSRDAKTKGFFFFFEDLTPIQ